MWTAGARCPRTQAGHSSRACVWFVCRVFHIVFYLYEIVLPRLPPRHQVFQFLQQQKQGLKHLTDTIKKDMRDMAILNHHLESGNR